MNAKPKDAIERMRAWLESRDFYELCQNYRHASDIKPHREGADTAAGAFERIKREIASRFPDGAVPVVWPAELTRERLEEAAEALAVSDWRDLSNALRALAAIAPVRKKRVVNLWEGSGGSTCWADSSKDGDLLRYGWKLVARNVELED